MSSNQNYEQVACLDINFGKLKLFMKKATFYPGSHVDGRLDLCLTDEGMFRGIWVKFCANLGLKISKHDKTNTTGEDISYDIDLLEDHEEYYLGGVHDVLLGLGEEAGEVQGKIKKLIRDKSFSKSEAVNML